MKNKIFSAVLAAILIATALMSCASPDKSKNSDNTKTKTTENITTVFSETTTPKEELPAEPENTEYKNAYSAFLLENQEIDTSSATYKKGEGRFTLCNINGDNIPELLIIDSFDNARVFTYDNGEVRSLSFECGWTDIFRFNYTQLRYNNENIILRANSESANSWTFIVPDDGNYDFIQYIKAFVDGGKYYFNIYDKEKMYADSIVYVWEYENCEVSETEYKQLLTENRIIEKNYKSIDSTDIYMIVPEVIEEILK